MQISLQSIVPQSAWLAGNSEVQQPMQRADNTPSSKEVCSRPAVPRTLWTSRESSRGTQLVRDYGFEPQAAHAYVLLERLAQIAPSARPSGVMPLPGLREHASVALGRLGHAVQRAHNIDRQVETDTVELRAAQRDLLGAAGAVRRFFDAITPGNTTPAQRLEDAQSASDESTAKQADAQVDLSAALERARSLLLQAGVCVP